MTSPTSFTRTLPLLTVLCALLLSGCIHRAADEPAPEERAAVEQTPQAEKNDAFAQLRSKAERGDLDSQFQLGSFYFVGNPKKDLKQAEYWWKQAADKGHANAAVSLAYLYTGRDNPQLADQQAMLKYLNQSAASGNPMAQHILARLYLQGNQGVPRDPDQARRLYQSACKNNYPASCEALAKLP